ncbi:MAG: ECF transporter S component [Bifidobacteriaceae bacterium]|nr:ECF transporter S component [Bifidobacteriaceae bacterium]
MVVRRKNFEMNAHAGSRLRWTTADIALGAAIGVAFGVVTWGFNFAYMIISPILGEILVGSASLLHAVWYMSGVVAVLLIRKPGAAVYVNVLGCFVQTIVGSSFAFTFVLISAALQGLFAEIPFALTRYKRYSLSLSMLSGLCVALEYGVYLMLFRYQGVSFISTRGIVHMISECVGGVVIAGIISWVLYKAIAKTGALDRFASGQQYRLSVQ